MSLEYLAKYLNKDEVKPRKRKRTTVRIVEDDVSGWTSAPAKQLEDQATVVENEAVPRKSAGFKLAYESDEYKDAVPANGAEDAAAKAILMGDGTRAGLQTKEQVQADLKARREADLQRAEEAKSSSHEKEHDTIYRDASGRRIDIALAKLEKARELKQLQEKQKKERDMSSGLVQQQEKAAQRKGLEDVRKEGFSRYVGNTESETLYKNRSRWNDPAAGFLSTTRTSESGNNGEARPRYKGGFAPNRFGIPPGYRWDGVDRGNGFEAARFKEIAKLEHRRQEYAEWSREDL